MITATRASSRAIGRGIAAIVGIDELMLGLALAGLTVALWPRFGREALIVPSLVLLWVYLPQRRSFLERSSEEKRSR